MGAACGARVRTLIFHSVEIGNHPDAGRAPSQPLLGERARGGQIETRATPLMFLISFGWDLNPSNKEGIVNAPKWLDTTKFDITAKAGANVRVDKFSSGNLINFEDLRNMLRALIEERFQMKWHMEDRPVTAYTLVAANPKLKPTADPTQRTRCKEGPGPDGKDPRITSPILNRLITCQNMTMAQICDEFQRVAAGYIYSPVLDSTGLKGSYDFTLSFSSIDQTRAAAAGSGSSSASASAAPATGSGAASTDGASDPSGALTLFDAVNRQLGLKLEARKMPVDLVIVDSGNKIPVEN